MMLFPLISHSVTNQELLDKLDDLEWDQMMRDQRSQQRENTQLLLELLKQRNKSQDNSNNNTPPKEIYTPKPYRNIETQEGRIKNSKLWNLSLSEYLRRDEIGSVECDKFYGKFDQFNPGKSGLNETYFSCYQSKLLNISFTETEMRRKRVKEKCIQKPELPEYQLYECFKGVMVFGK